MSFKEYFERSFLEEKAKKKKKKKKPKNKKRTMWGGFWGYPFHSGANGEGVAIGGDGGGDAGGGE